jgi:hypothetical protein
VIFNLGFTTALFGLGMSQSSFAQKSENSTATGSNAIHHYFFKDPTFEMIFLTSLGRAYHCGGNVGKDCRRSVLILLLVEVISEILLWIALYATSESAPNFTRVRHSDSIQSRFATVPSSALFGTGTAVGYPFSSAMPSGP